MAGLAFMCLGADSFRHKSGVANQTEKIATGSRLIQANAAVQPASGPNRSFKLSASSI
jgi:hypothetical protein